MFKTIRSKIMISHLGFVAILAVFMGIAGYYVLVSHTSLSQERQMRFSASHGAEMLGQIVEEKEGVFSDIIKGPEIGRYVKTFDESLLRKYFYRYMDDFHVLSMINEDGKETLRMDHSKLADDLSDRSNTNIFKDVTWVPNQIYAELGPVGEGTGPGLMIGIKRESNAGDHEGTVIGEIEIKELIKPLHRLVVGETGFIMLMDGSGRILYHPDQTLVSKLIPEARDSGEIVRRAMNLEVDFFRTPINGTDGFVALAPVKGMDWTFLTVMPYEEFMATPLAMKRVSMIVTGFMIVGGFIMSLLLSSGIAKPVKRLEEAVRKVGDFDLSQRVSTNSSDEIGALARSFNQMMEKLQEAVVERDIEIDERKSTEKELHKLSSAVEQSPTSIVITDIHGNIEYVNPKFTDVTGYTFNEVIGKNPRIFNSGMKPKKFYEDLWKTILSGEGWRGEIQNRKKNGELFWEYVYISPIKNEKGEITHFVSVKEEITKKKHAEEALQRQAYYDQLTALPNRVLFSKHLQRVLKRLKKSDSYLFAVFFMDLDRFKVINDSLGHMIGDQLLVAVARRLETCIRPNDIIARFGGDEFAILVDDIKSVNEATHIADRVQQKLSFPFNLDGHEVFTSASIGIALSSSGYEGLDDILRDADSAMYRAKTLGKARYEIFDTAMHTHAVKLLKMEADLRRAVEREEFELYYQPIISLKTGRICGVEALLRWVHAEQGIILPREFISLAEETGLISPIGEWVLREACSKNKAWIDAGLPPIEVKVNFSPRQFHHHNISNMVKVVLRETGLAAKYLDIEITESAIADERCSIMLGQLSKIGVNVSIDDFGTGYSSIGTLKRFPVNTIKIDRSFVKDMAIDVHDEAIVKTIIAMAHNLKVKVLAEGVETEEQKALLISLGCDEMQGFIISKPLPHNEIYDLLTGRKIIKFPGRQA